MMTCGNEFTYTTGLYLRRFSTSDRNSLLRASTVRNFVYNKIQEYYFGQTMLSSGENHPADDLILLVYDRLSASGYGRHMLPLNGGSIKGISQDFSGNYRVRISAVISDSSRCCLKKNPRNQRPLHHHSNKHNPASSKLSSSLHPSLRLGGDQPGFSICRSNASHGSFPGRSLLTSTKKSPIICNIVTTLSVTGINFTCGISLI